MHPTSLTDRLTPYIPTDRLHAIAAGEVLPGRQRGAVMMADISGFTPLTEQLVRGFGARRGGEELTRHLNLVYGALNDEIERFRGSVIGFSGDAVTCWFDGDSGLAAIRCALQLQALMQRFSDIEVPAGAPVSLAIKVAIAAGEVRRFMVGDPEMHVVDVLCGSALDRVASAEHAAARGEVVVSREVVDACPRAIVARWADNDQFAVIEAIRDELPAPAGWPALHATAFDTADLHDQLRVWLLPAVYQRLRSGQGDYLAELRHAAALFLKFDGFDFERDDAVAGKLDAYVRWVQSVLHHYEGALIQVTTGDKGSYLYAAFGALLAHEDAAERAVNAALALRSPPPALAFIAHTHIGISRGQMRTGGYGSERRRTYGVLGDETNVAARLMTTAAAGQILVSGAIVKSCPGYHFESLGELMLKGKQAAVPVFELHGRATDREQRRARTREPIIGRAHECERIQTALDRLCSSEPGPGRIVLAEGDPGIGKSRLSGELLDRARRARDPQIRCLVTRATAIEHAVPYFALRQVFVRLLELPPGLEGTPALAHVTARVPAALAPYAPLLGVVLQVDLPDSAATLALEGAMRATATRRYLAQLFTVLCAGQPTLMVIEDAHFLDSATWATLELALELPARLLIGLAARTHHAPSEGLERARNSRVTERITVQAMSPEDTVALVAARLGVTALPAEVAELVSRVSEGNPLFAEEIGHSLREAGLIKIADGVCTVIAALDTLPFPETIEGVVTSRIDRLSPAEQLTLKVASVIGRAFQLAPVEDAFPVIEERGGVARSLATLSALDLTSHDDRDADPVFTFKHAITQDVAYNLMLFEQRRTLHHKVADWYERAAAADPSTYAIVAYHRVRAIDGDERPDPLRVTLAIDALSRAGRRSVEAGASAEAVAYLTRARALLATTPPSRARSVAELDLCSWIGTGLTLVRGPMSEDVRREFARARELAAEIDDVPRLFETLFNLWYASVTGSDRAGALEVSTQLLELAGDDPVLQMLANHAHGAVLISSGQHAEGLALMRAVFADRRALSDATALSRVRDPRLMSHCYSAWATLFLGFPDRSLTHALEALDAAHEAPHPINHAQALCFTALVHRNRGEVDDTQYYIDKAKAIESEHASPYWIVVRTSIEAWVIAQRGDLARGVAIASELCRRDREAAVFPLGWITYRGDLIDWLTQLGRYPEAHAIANEARTVFGVRLLGFGEPEIHRLEGELWRQEGDHARARPCFTQAIALSRTQGAKMMELRALTSFARSEPAALPELRALYRWFTEGQQLPDLVAARELLAAAPHPRNVEAVEVYVLDRLGRELSPLLTYHCTGHTCDDVVPALKRLLAVNPVPERDAELVITAAWLHDVGFIECVDGRGHEQVSIRVAREVLPGFGFTADDIAVVVGIITATIIPQSPRTALEQLMADADLDVLGRDDFAVKNEALRRERINVGDSIPPGAWSASQAKFLRTHEYFTPAATQLRARGKQWNLASFERRSRDLL